MTAPNTHTEQRPATLIRYGTLEIDRERYRVTADGRAVKLTYMEFRVLVAIAERSGRVASYDELGQEFWGAASASTRRRLSVLVSRLRAKLGDAAPYVDTVHRVGYRLSSP